MPYDSDNTRRRFLTLAGSALSFPVFSSATAEARADKNTVRGTVRGVVGDGRVQIGGRADKLALDDDRYRIEEISDGSHMLHVFDFGKNENAIQQDGNQVFKEKITIDGDLVYDITVDTIRYGWERFREPTDWAGVKASIDRFADFGLTDLMVDAFYHSQTIWPSEYATHQQHALQPNPPDDFLKNLIEYAHEKGMRVHAWFEGTLYWWDVNYFGDPPEGHILDGNDVITVNGEEYTVDRSLLTADAKGNYADGTKLFVSPFSDEVVRRLKNIIRELDSKYNIDGINLDRVAFPESETEFGFGPSSPLSTEMSEAERYRRRVDRINELVDVFGEQLGSTTVYSVGTAYVYYRTLAHFRDPKYWEIVRNASHQPSDWIGTTGVDWITPYFYLPKSKELAYAIDLCQDMQAETVSVPPGLGALDWLPSIEEQHEVYDRFNLPGYGVFRASDLEHPLPYQRHS